MAPCRDQEGSGWDSQLAVEDEGCCSSFDTASLRIGQPVSISQPAPCNLSEKCCINNGRFYLLVSRSGTFHCLTGEKSVLLTAEKKKVSFQSKAKPLSLTGSFNPLPLFQLVGLVVV